MSRNVVALLRRKLVQLPFGSAASLGALGGHLTMHPLARAECGVQLSGLVAVEYIAVGVLIQPVFEFWILFGENFICRPLTSR